MKKLSSSYMLRVATFLLILLAVAKAISLAVWWFLPSDGVELQVKDNYKPKYQRVDFKNMLNAGIRTKNDSKTYQDSSASGISITNMVLKGLYGKGSKGFAIVALKSSLKKTSIVSVGEVFSGYTLKTILNDGVIFTKSSKEYVLKMLHSKITKESVMSSVQSSEPKGISRADIDFYSKNPKEIWKDISIREVKKGGKIKGFKVTKIKKNSKMARLGIQKGDIIIKANNIELKSYKDALNLYGKINDLDTIQIVILRNNQEKEIVYDIN